MAGKERKPFYIRVHGFYSPRFATIEGTIEEMLRYDKGEIVLETTFLPLRNSLLDESVKSRREFYITIKCTQWTEERWQSFGLKTWKVDSLKLKEEVK